MLGKEKVKGEAVVLNVGFQPIIFFVQFTMADTLKKLQGQGGAQESGRFRFGSTDGFAF